MQVLGEDMETVRIPGYDFIGARTRERFRVPECGFF